MSFGLSTIELPKTKYLNLTGDPGKGCLDNVTFNLGLDKVGRIKVEAKGEGIQSRRIVVIKIPSSSQTFRSINTIFYREELRENYNRHFHDLLLLYVHL